MPACRGGAPGGAGRARAESQRERGGRGVHTIIDGAGVGTSDGCCDGVGVGSDVGSDVGVGVGSDVGSWLGDGVGNGVGSAVGALQRPHCQSHIPE